MTTLVENPLIYGRRVPNGFENRMLSHVLALCPLIACANLRKLKRGIVFPQSHLSLLATESSTNIVGATQCFSKFFSFYRIELYMET